MKRKEPPKPRNPFVQHLVVRKGGVHGKSKKAMRVQNKVELKKEIQHA